jgi:hypothetical protein
MRHGSNFVQGLLLGEADGPNPLIKPDVSFGSYFLEWDEKSLGLYSNEILRFKTFVKNLIPFLEQIMKTIEIPRLKKHDGLRKIMGDKGHITIVDKYDDRIVFVLNVDTDGSTALFREERISINNELFEKLQAHYDYDGCNLSVLLEKLQDISDVVSVKWKIGDLLFNRVKQKTK